MSVETYQRAVQSHLKELARLQHNKGQEASKAADLSRKSADAHSAAARSSTPSTRSSKERDAQRHLEDSAKSQKKVADLESQIAREQGRLADAEKKLADARSQVARQQSIEQQRLTDDHERRMKEQARQSQEQERRLRDISGTLEIHDALHRVAAGAIEKLSRLPDKITILFFASNPMNQSQLRLDEEVRSIAEMLRKSNFRDAVRLESRWAVRPQDLLQAINETEPTIIHFSGHGTDDDQIVFQDNSGVSKLVSKEAIVSTMAACSDKIQLVFFNTCYSHNQARAVVEHVPAAIGMTTSIGDETARVFSSQFYSSIGFGHSVRRAFDQAKAAVMLEGIPEDSTPELFTTPTLDADLLTLVKTPSPV